MKKTGFFIKTILLAVFLVAVSVVPAHAQRDGFMGGARMFLEAERLRMESRMAEQQIELIRQQIESMKMTRREFANELFQKGFQEGYMTGYKRGTNDTVDYIKKTEGEIQVIVFNFVGKELFSETSIENLVEARKFFLLSLNTPNHYVAKVYIALIDARLEELRQRQK